MSDHILQPGVKAPEFTLKCTPDQTVSLAEVRGRPLVLAFYPADFSPVCSDQMAVYNQILDEFRAYQAHIFGVSVDGAWCHSAFADERHLHFPLLADFEPKGDVARAYGVYNTREGVSERALFVIDPAGSVFWSYLSPMGVNPGADGILDALARMSGQREVHP
jgi:peroxiredoxin